MEKSRKPFITNAFGFCQLWFRIHFHHITYKRECFYLRKPFFARINSYSVKPATGVRNAVGNFTYGRNVIGADGKIIVITQRKSVFISVLNRALVEIRIGIKADTLFIGEGDPVFFSRTNCLQKEKRKEEKPFAFLFLKFIIVRKGKKEKKWYILNCSFNLLNLPKSIK